MQTAGRENIEQAEKSEKATKRLADSKTMG
jgi:hypothetical protein